ncbi:MAG: SMP-30/gluconolactonase/LRE family protein [Williamsia sp.]|nr:SMP-30/gluconolactonase/LRE family protein [Williamsia sp.]
MTVTAYSQSAPDSAGWIEQVDPALQSLVKKDARIQIIAGGLDWSEGPLWIESKKMLLFSDVPQNIIYKWTEKGGKETYLTPSGYTGTIPRGGETGSNGLVLDPEGRLVICQHGDRRMARMNAPLDKPQSAFTTLADNYKGKKFDSPNDAVYHRNGDLYFTDPPYGLEQKEKDPRKEAPYQGVYRVSKGGQITLLTDTLTRPNGLAFFPGYTKLLIANSDPEKPYWYLFDVNGEGLPTNPKIFHDATAASKKAEGLPDGLKIDHNGNVFATGPGGVWIFNAAGKLLGKIRTKTIASNCSFSTDQKTLYVTADEYVLKVGLR